MNLTFNYFLLKYYFGSYKLILYFSIKSNDFSAKNELDFGLKIENNFMKQNYVRLRKQAFDIILNY